MAVGIAGLGADAPLEQHRGGWQPEPFVVVVGGDQGDGRAGAADSPDDGAQHVGEFGADDQQPFSVGLGRGDLQQRHQLAGAWQPVLDQAVAELDQFLGADAFSTGPWPVAWRCVNQSFDGVLRRVSPGVALVTGSSSCSPARDRGITGCGLSR
ncbi:MAG: hypothetical protein ACRDPY_18605 [Streptosporangiaceae bacterium]